MENVVVYVARRSEKKVVEGLRVQSRSSQYSDNQPAVILMPEVQVTHYVSFESDIALPRYDSRFGIRI